VGHSDSSAGTLDETRPDGAGLWLEGGTLADGTGADPAEHAGVLVLGDRIFAGDPLTIPEHFADPERVALVLQEGRLVKLSGRD
jgi:hypothetical protein